MQDLGALQGYDSAAAVAINDFGQVVGVAFNASSVCPSQLFVWTKAEGMQKLSTASNCLYPNAINDRGQIVGDQIFDGAFLWSRTEGLQYLSGFAGGAQATNIFGQIAGSAILNDCSFRAVLWTSTAQMQNLGLVPGTPDDCASESLGYGINAFGQVVGQSASPSTGQSAFLWTSAAGMQDLNLLFQNTGWHMPIAYGINFRGQIVGMWQNQTTFDVHAVLLRLGEKVDFASAVVH